MRAYITSILAFGFISLCTPGRADTVLDFQNALATVGSDTPFFTPLSISGFTLAATNPPTGFSSGFEAHGSTSLFYAGEVGLLALAPATTPDNVVKLTDNANNPFTLDSIDLARNFPFDPAPTVTFTGTKVGGGTVTQTFTVTVPVGTAAFQTFDFTGFTNLVSVSWGQPPLEDGLHQFADIHVLETPAAAPEPVTWLLVAIALAAAALYRRRQAPVTEPRA